MLNTTEEIIISCKKHRLAALIQLALILISDIITKGSHRLGSVISNFIALFKSQEKQHIEPLLKELYRYTIKTQNHDYLSKHLTKATFLAELSPPEQFKAKTILRLIFIYLHKNNAIILTYKFTRPLDPTFTTAPNDKYFYCETVLAFLRFEANLTTTINAGKPSRGNRRLWQSGVKSILMSDMVTPEKINHDDLHRLLAQQSKNTPNNIIPTPVLRITEHLIKCFPARVPESVQSWAAEHLSTSKQLSRNLSSMEMTLIEEIERKLSALETAKRIVKIKKFGATSFSSDLIHHYKLDTHIFKGSKKLNNALRVWTHCETAYLENQFFEKNKGAKLAFGKLNVYLFIYLPLWIQHNPQSKFQYPSTPSDFTGSVHYSCNSSDNVNRPLSLCELFSEIGYVESYGSQTPFRNFFQYLITYGSELEGCKGLEQPVRKVPKSKKYRHITKNVFTGEQLQQFIAYHHALNSGADYFLLNSSRIKKIVDAARANNTLVDTEKLGYVPIMYHESTISYITRILPDTFHFITHQLEYFYNPGCVIFSLFLLECGVRGQTLQWLDADTYDRTSQRLSQNPLQLTSIWLNTDKIQKIPFIIVTTMGNLSLLDQQRKWRLLMIKKGAIGFTKKVYYDHNPKSHWGKISPLFAAHPENGDPFSDDHYKTLWNCHCLNFQIWLKDNTYETNPIVGYLPLRKKSAQRHFTWEDWINKINPDDVHVIPGNPSNKVYQGAYCPISLRAYATPHGARGSFITDMSVNLPPEAMTFLTGQSLSTIIRYNKGHHLLINRLQGAFNNRDASWFLTNPFKDSPSMYDIRDRIEDAVRQNSLPNTITKFGLTSFPTSTSPRELTGLMLIASDRSLRLGACYTHICPHNFICPQLISVKFCGQKRCAQCPFAIFSIHNLPAIEAHRQKMAEEYSSTCTIVEKYNATNIASTAETNRLQEEIKNSAKEVISWMMVEEILWAKLEAQQQAAHESNNRDFIASNASQVIKEVTRVEYNSTSVEGFLSRLDSACTYPESISQNFEYKIDRATRLLMISDGDTLGAAMMPSNFPNAIKLAGMIRSDVNFNKMDIQQLVHFINLADSDWEQALLSFHAKKISRDGSS
ncbi:hypothetical protein F3J44_24175 [Pantoea sp. Tr-811]|uniref:hypothetical protein n=1 Tax=Pantoea sp. Tr-811 TaxID=2608361 RepID=UPI001421CBEE|nr:hypothetical protein [Pantoea sp. Tr-811]NIF29452.1 hypothetical protein [Pantoea sp. Tr-811]